jgi:hypothetical protein
LKGVDMSEDTKTPKPGEWWIRDDGKARAYFCGVDSHGLLVYEHSLERELQRATDNWPNWHHEPRCDSFDWVEPEPEPEQAEWSDMASIQNLDLRRAEMAGRISWAENQAIGQVIAIAKRAIQPVETWPKYIVADHWEDTAYLRCDGRDKNVAICPDGTERVASHLQSSIDSLIQNGTWRYVTEAEALARVKLKAAPLPALVPGIPTDRMVDLFLSWRLPSDFRPDGGISFTERPLHENWPTGTNLFTSSQARKMIEYLLSVPEDTARVTPVKRTASQILGEQSVTLSVSGDTILISCLNRDDADTIFEWLESIGISDPSPFAKPFTNPRSGMGIKKEPVESPDDWVVQDRVPVRAGDEIRWSNWTDKNLFYEVREGHNLTDNHRHGFVDPEDGLTLFVRCRRRDLPAAKPKRIPVRLYWYDGNIVGRYANAVPTDPSFVEIHSDGESGWYVIGS